MNMFNKNLSLILSIILIISLVLTGCNNSNNNEKILYTINVETVGGLLLEDVLVTVYKDGEMQQLQWKAETDENGEVTFNAEPSKTYYAVLDKVPNGYKLDSVYEISSENTNIVLETVLHDNDDISSTNFKLGSIVSDFTVTTTNGENYKVSDLLKSKKAIVLNFWFLNCQPCKLEFPYLQQAYNDFSEKLEVIAINPVDGNNVEINSFAQSNELTFPMVRYDGQLNFEAYPTTVVIDRYGTICMIHRGSITSKEEFVKIFEYFTVDEYQQKLIKNISDIK